MPLHCVRRLGLRLHLSLNLLDINTRHMQARDVLDLRVRDKREGTKPLCSKCVFTCVMDGLVCYVWPVSFCYLVFPAVMLVDQHKTVKMLPSLS